MKRFFFLTLLVFLLYGCAKHSSSYLKQIDNSTKTINVSTSNKYLFKDIKSIFRNNGWKVMVLDDKQFETLGSIGVETNLETKTKNLGKYRVVIEQRSVDICFDFDPYLRYNISIVENETGEEVFLSEGQDCAKKIAEKLELDLKDFW